MDAPWKRPMRPAPWALTSVLATLVAIGVGCGGSTTTNGSSAKPAAKSRPPASAPARYDAPGKADPPQPAADFALRNQDGQLVQLSRYRGKAVLLTFIYTHCQDTCPLIVGNLHGSLAKLGPSAAQAQVLAVSVDPTGDTPRTVKRFLALHDMTGRMEYLVGSQQQLAPVWKDYGIQVEASPAQREVNHSSSVYGITGSGNVAVLYPANFKPAWVAHDVPVLAAH